MPYPWFPPKFHQSQVPDVRALQSRAGQKCQHGALLSDVPLQRECGMGPDPPQEAEIRGVPQTTAATPGQGIPGEVPEHSGTEGSHI